MLPLLNEWVACLEILSRDNISRRLYPLPIGLIILIHLEGYLMIITVGAEKGGVAKTRLATNLAALAAGDGADVVLLDTDRQGSATSWVRLRQQEGDAVPQFPVLALPPRPATELASLSTKYDLIVVDIGAQNYRTMMEAALLSDLVLVPCGNDQQEVESTLTVVEALVREGPRHPKGAMPLRCVLTRVSPVEYARSTDDLRGVLADADVPLLSAQLAYRAAWAHSGKTGLAVHELRGKDKSVKAASEMRAVYDEIVNILQGKGATHG